MAGNVLEVTDTNFEAEILKAGVPALVDFWAPWCGPCKSIAPIIEELSKTYSGKFKIAKMNVDENPRTPTNYDVRGIPNLVFFKNGAVAEQVVGAVPKEQIVEVIERLL